MSRMERHNEKPQKVKKEKVKGKSTGKKILLWIFGIILVLILAVGGLAAKVYFDVKGTADKIQDTTVRKTSDRREKKVSVKDGDPISILLLGIDTGDLGRTEQGRSDTMMVATLNPNTNSSSLVSIPRDTYTDIIGHNTKDKLNHAYAFGGAEMSMLSMENLLDIPIDHYVSVNMGGVQKIVDVVGGIDIQNNLQFSSDGFDFPIGMVHLDGEGALAFIRMRYEDPNGDYGRQGRQRDVVTAVMKKALNLSNIANYDEILKSLQDSVKTDLSWDQLLSLQSQYSGAFQSIEPDQLKGNGIMLSGISYQEIPTDELSRVQTKLKEQLEVK